MGKESEDAKVLIPDAVVREEAWKNFSNGDIDEYTVLEKVLKPKALHQFHAADWERRLNPPKESGMGGEKKGR